jgi:plastocyanin
MRLPHVGVVAAALAVSGALTACGGGATKQATSSTSAAPNAPAATPAGERVDPATAGGIKGVVKFEGPVPKNDPIKMNADPTCVAESKGPQYQEYYEVDNGDLANVFVYVKDGLGNYVFDTPTEPVKLEQKDCRYVPHVFGIRVGQPLQIINADPTLHNIHAIPKVNQEFNNGQPIQGMKTTHVFTAPEVMIPFKCDVHGWMNAWIGVVSNPYFAVTGKDGTFDLRTLPPGTYTIEAWHEKLGTQTQTVTVGKNETKEITFTFKAGGATTTS